MCVAHVVRVPFSGLFTFCREEQSKQAEQASSFSMFLYVSFVYLPYIFCRATRSIFYLLFRNLKFLPKPFQLYRKRNSVHRQRTCSAPALLGLLRVQTPGLKEFQFCSGERTDLVELCTIHAIETWDLAIKWFICIDRFEKHYLPLLNVLAAIFMRGD